MAKMLDIFRALADPTRLRIVQLLRTMELSVGELAQVLAQSQPRVSRHIKILCDAGVAERRKEGSWVFIGPGPAAVTEPLAQALDAWMATLGQDPWHIADAARLAAVRADRAAAAERYFADHADHWDSLRSLHVPEAEVEAAMRRVLGTASLGTLVDIGTGTGRMIELFGAQARHAIGIDRSPEMLRVARGKLTASGTEGWDLRQGDIMALPLEDAMGDTVVLHQVLHYLPAPEAAIVELARIIAPGGRLLIVDFAPHSHEELRTQDAHARLGFSDEQMALWFRSAGLEMAQTTELAGRALTVKLWLATRPKKKTLQVIGG
ncbi:MAG: metalloregulator ArsR/SmtB family transcription factor [Alphaproteobacteria bacterium]|nr:metalloregulator ArsR/SmtB family transcription factor [Alphaproteobacteria bacterium]